MGEPRKFPLRSPKPKAASKRERRCLNEECNKILSRYNKGKYCFSCDAPGDAQIPSMHMNRQ